MQNCPWPSKWHANECSMTKSYQSYELLYYCVILKMTIVLKNFKSSNSGSIKDRNMRLVWLELWCQILLWIKLQRVFIIITHFFCKILSRKIHHAKIFITQNFTYFSCIHDFPSIASIFLTVLRIISYHRFTKIC